MNRLLQIGLASIVAGLLVSASPAPAACQDESTEVECSCLYRSPAQKYRGSDLVVVGWVSPREYPDTMASGYQEDVAMILVDRIEKGRSGPRRIKLLGAWIGDGCCTAGLPSDGARYRFYLHQGDAPQGYYRLSGYDQL